LKWF